MKNIPAAGLIGAAALREAQATELRAVLNIVMEALRKRRGDAYVEPEAVYPDRVVVYESGRYMAWPYSLDAGNVATIGEPFEVVQQHVPAALREARASADDSVFVEAEATPGRWLIRVIRAGMSGNRNFYPDAVLREATGLFEGARVFVKSDAEHLSGHGKDVRNLLGGLTRPRFIEGKAPDSGEIQAVLQLIEPDGATAVKMREAYARGLSGLFGFSIDCSGSAETAMREGQRVRVAQRIGRVSSVDLIVEPGAGGELIRLAEAQDSTPTTKDDDMNLRTRMIEAIKAKRPDFVADGLSDDALETAYLLSLTPAPVSAPPDNGAAAQALAAVRMIEARTTARELVSGSTLPAPAKERLLARFAEATEPFTAEAVKTQISAERDYLAKFVESGKVQVPFEGIVQVEDKTAATAQMLDDFFAGKPGSNSFRECYAAITGDVRVTGRVRDMDHARMAESLGIPASARFIESISTSTFSNALGDSIHRAMIAAYEGDTDKQAWRKIVRVVPRNDFRTNELVRMGGYGNLPAVTQGAAYAALSTPSDEKATYAVTKRGGTEDLTLEAIRNDDVGLIRRIPLELALAASNTLYEFVFDFLRTNPTIYDSVALFHASHGNLGTTALAAPAFAATRLAMAKQTRSGSGKRINAGPAYLCVPFDLQETAWDLFVRGTNNDKNYVQSLNPEVIPVDYWTDANDWVAVANPQRCPTIEVGFLDGNETPELFVQDSPTVGSMFSNDKLTWKIRHIYGAAVEEYRGMYKHVVA